MSIPLALFQLLDSSLPVGAFSHSFGLETLVQDGAIETEADLQSFLEHAIWGAWSQNEALLVGAVWVLEPPQLFELENLMDASRVSREAREAQRKIGRQALKLARATAPTLDFSTLQNPACRATWPLVFGWWAQQLGAHRDLAATGFLFSSCQSSLSACVRLSILGQTRAQALLSQMAPVCEAAWASVREQNPFEFSNSLLGLEWAQVQHESLEARLFMS